MKRLWTVVMVLAMALAMTLPSGAVTAGGYEDVDDDFPSVILIIADVGGAPAFRCSGTVIAPTFVLTAGHCTSNFPGAPITGMRIFTEQDVQNGDNNYPFGGGNNTIEAVAWASHPLYTTAPFFFNDVGMIELAEPMALDSYPSVIGVGELDALKTRRGQQNQTFDAVGYGLQRINPVFVEADRARYVAHPHLIQINVPGFTGGFSLLLSNNHSTGGTCFGDSGGPNFLGGTDTVAAVTSFGINGNCAGTGGVFRLDKQNVHDFINGFMGS